MRSAVLASKKPTSKSSLIFFNENFTIWFCIWSLSAEIMMKIGWESWRPSSRSTRSINRLVDHWSTERMATRGKVVWRSSVRTIDAPQNESHWNSLKRSIAMLGETREPKRKRSVRFLPTYWRWCDAEDRICAETRIDVCLDDSDGNRRCSTTRRALSRVNCAAVFHLFARRAFLGKIRDDWSEALRTRWSVAWEAQWENSGRYSRLTKRRNFAEWSKTQRSTDDFVSSRFTW